MSNIRCHTGSVTQIMSYHQCHNTYVILLTSHYKCIVSVVKHVHRLTFVTWYLTNSTPRALL